MRSPAIFFSAEDTQIVRKMNLLAAMDPAFSGGLDRLELDGRPVTSAEEVSLLVSGFEEVHRIDEGFSLAFGAAVMRGNWTVSGRSRANYVRLRVSFSGATTIYHAGAPKDPKLPSLPCFYVAQPAGARLIASFAGGQEHIFCVLTVTERYLRKTLGITWKDLPNELKVWWTGGESGFGEFKLSEPARQATRHFFGARGEGAWRSIEIRAFALSLLGCLFADWQRAPQSARAKLRLTPGERARVYAVRDRIRRDSGRAVTLRGLCAITGLNRNKMSISFRTLFGSSIKQFALQERMQLGIEMLKDSTLSISDVADRLGYSEPTNFVATFRRRYGETPLRYRNRLKADKDTPV